MWESHLEGKKCKNHSHAIFTIPFYESQVKYLRKAFTKEQKVIMIFYTIISLLIEH